MGSRYNNVYKMMNINFGIFVTRSCSNRKRRYLALIYVICGSRYNLM